jgi:hypothetical protein
MTNNHVQPEMDPATIVLLLKIISDIILMLTMGMPDTSGMTPEEKKAKLLDLQAGTAKLIADLEAKANA